MKKQFIIITSFLLLTFISLGQKTLLDKFIAGDTLKIGVDRMGDRFGPYDQDTILLIKTSTAMVIHSDKSGKWYKADETIFKALQKIEKDGLKGKGKGLLRVDSFYFKFHGKTSNLSLPPKSFDDFMLLLTTNYSDSSARPLG